MKTDPRLNRFLTSLVESYGLRLTRKPEETSAGGLRLDVHDADVGPLWGHWEIHIPPLAPGWGAIEAIEALHLTCARICEWDAGPLENRLDARDFARMKEAA